MQARAGSAVWLAGHCEPAGRRRPALAGVAVFLGHLFPVFYRFQGGKGVATAAGVLLGLTSGSVLARS